MDRFNTIEDAVEALYDLNVGVVGQGAERHERPHKPVMMLTVLDLMALGKATPDRILWSLELRQRFAEYFELVRSRDDQCNPELPYYWLKGDGFWEHGRQEPGSPTLQPLQNTPTVGDAKTGRVFARFKEGFERFVVSPMDRLKLRVAVVSRYFPQHRSALAALFADGQAGMAAVLERESRLGEEEAPEYEAGRQGRSCAFRKKVLEIYDYQCAACGLRIKVPEVDDLTFVDAAHLIPFRQSFNDNPRNGMALCKNHHWAMDRFLIAPSQDGLWKVSPILDARRSKGEEELLALASERILLPSEEAFRPDETSLRWRCSRLKVATTELL